MSAKFKVFVDVVSFAMFAATLAVFVYASNLVATQLIGAY